MQKCQHKSLSYKLTLAVTTMHSCRIKQAILFSTFIQLKKESAALETDIGYVASTS